MTHGTPRHPVRSRTRFGSGWVWACNRYGLPYSCKTQMRLDEITGGSPYGASTIAGGDGSRQPSEGELSMARFQGEHVAKIAAKLSGNA